MPTDLTPHRVVLQLGRTSLSLWGRRRDGSLHSFSGPLSAAAAIAPTLQALLPAALAELGSPSQSGSLELVVVNERPVARFLRRELPQVTLLATAGVHEALHDALRPRPQPGLPTCGGRSLLDPSFAWVGDAAELFPAYTDLTALCPATQLLSVDERLTAEGAVYLPLSPNTQAELVERAVALAAPAAVVLLHSPRSSAHEQALVAALAQAGLPATSSAAQLPAHRGGLDERLRVRAAVLSAALSPGWEADLAALRSGLGAALAPGRRARLLTPRPDGALVPIERLPLWQSLLGPLAAALRGATLASAAEVGGRFFLVSEPAADWAQELPATPGAAADAGGADDLAASSQATRPGLAAVGQTGTAVWQPGYAALCLGIPCELAGSCVVLAARADMALEQVRALAQAYGWLPLDETSPPPAAPQAALPSHTTPSQTATWVEDLGGTALPLRRLEFAATLAQGALAAPIRDERVQPLWAEASGAQESGLLSAALRRLSSLAGPDEGLASPGTSPPGADSLASSPGDWTADLRYPGQVGMLSLRGVGTGGPAASAATDLVVRFVAEHERVYGFSLPQCPVELVQVRFTARR